MRHPGIPWFLKMPRGNTLADEWLLDGASEIPTGPLVAPAWADVEVNDPKLRRAPAMERTDK